MEKLRALGNLLFICFSFYGTYVPVRGEDSLFNEIKLEYSKLYFKNSLKETPDFNYYIFTHMYMGTGVSTGLLL